MKRKKNNKGVMMAKGSKQDKLIYAAYALLIISPVIYLAIRSLTLHINLFYGVPSWSDELDYFRELYSFSEHGFNFGGSLFAGFQAPHGPLGAHSFSPILVWGLFSLIFPWTEHSILLINLLLLCVAWGVFCFMVSPEGMDIFYAFMMAFFYVPLNMYLHTSMMETALYAFLLIYFSVFYKYRKTRSKALLCALIVIGAYISFARITYVVILFPVIWLSTDYNFSLRTVRNMLIYVISFVVGYKLYGLFCADYPDWVTNRISTALGPIGKIRVIAGNIKVNLRLFFGIDGRSQAALRYAFLALIIILLVFSFVYIEDSKVKFKFNKERFSLLFMSGGLLVIMIALYDIKDWRDYRTFAPIGFLLLLCIYFFEGKDTTGAKMKWLSLGVMLLLVAFSSNKLYEGRECVKHVKYVEGFESLETIDKEGNPLTLGTSFDINWGTCGLMESIPSQLGFVTFYRNAVVEKLDAVDYVLLSENYAADNADVVDNLVYITDISGYGFLYRVGE